MRWTGTGNAAIPAITQNGHSEVLCRLSDKITLFICNNKYLLGFIILASSFYTYTCLARSKAAGYGWSR
jgi:hypothetical protein